MDFVAADLVAGAFVAGARFTGAFFAVVVFVAVVVFAAVDVVALLAGAFLAGAFFAVALLVAVDFLAGAFLAGAFFAVALLVAVAFLAEAFFAEAFFAEAFFAGAFLAGAFLPATRAGSGPSSVRASATGLGVRAPFRVAERARSSTCEASPATVVAKACTSLDTRLTSSLARAESTSRRIRRTRCLRLAWAARSSSSATPLTCLAAFLRDASDPARATISAAASLARLRVSSPSPDVSST